MRIYRPEKRQNLGRHDTYHRTEAGELPYRKIGALLRFVPAELRTWVDAQMGGAPRAATV